MKTNKKIVLNVNRSPKTIARFGAAHLVKLSGSQLRVYGGSSANYGEAKEWISLFMHDAVLLPPQ